MWTENEEYDEQVFGPKPDWYHRLSPQQQAWRATQVLKGRNPDKYIEERLIDAGEWPPAKPST